MTTDSLRKRPAPFRLNKLNLILVGCVTVAYLAGIDTPDSEYSVAYVLGKALGFLLIPLLLALVVWLLFRQKEGAGNRTFTVIALLMIFLHFRTVHPPLSESMELAYKQSIEIQEELNKAMNATDDWEELERLRAEFLERFEEILSKAATGATDDERAGLAAVKKHMATAKQLAAAWELSYDGLRAPGVWNFPGPDATNAEYLAAGFQALKQDRDRSAEYKIGFSTLLGAIRTDLASPISDAIVVESMLSGFLKAFESLEQPLDYLTDARSGHIESERSLLRLMEASPDAWEFDGESIIPLTSEFDAQSQPMMERIAHDEKEVERLIEQLLRRQ